MKNESKKKEVKRQSSKAQKGFSSIKFLLTYLILMGGMALSLSLESIKKIIDINGIYTKFIVQATAKLLEPFGFVRAIQGSIIHLKGISLDVKFGCNGLEAFLIYMVAILAFPASWRKRLEGIIAGFVVIQFFNIIRIAALGYCGVHFKNFFYVFHMYVAQGIMIAVAFVLFLVWLNYAVKE